MEEEDLQEEGEDQEDGTTPNSEDTQQVVQDEPGQYVVPAEEAEDAEEAEVQPEEADQPQLNQDLPVCRIRRPVNKF